MIDSLTHTDTQHTRNVKDDKGWTVTVMEVCIYLRSPCGGHIRAHSRHWKLPVYAYTHAHVGGNMARLQCDAPRAFPGRGVRVIVSKHEIHLLQIRGPQNNYTTTRCNYHSSARNGRLVFLLMRTATPGPQLIRPSRKCKQRGLRFVLLYVATREGQFLQRN